MTLLLFLYALVAGYFSGFLGIGISVLLMPFFLFFMNLPYEIAVDMSLMTTFVTSIASLLMYYLKREIISWEPCIPMIVSGSLAALLGSFYLIHLISPLILIFCFIGVLFVNVDFYRCMLKGNMYKTLPQQFDVKRFFFKYIAIGTTAGLSASLLGIAGGILIVPFLLQFTYIYPKEAVKSATVVMIFTTFFGLSADIITFDLPLYLGSVSIFGGLIGTFLGSIALKYISSHIITRYNYLISIAVAFIMLYRALIF